MRLIFLFATLFFVQILDAAECTLDQVGDIFKEYVITLDADSGLETYNKAACENAETRIQAGDRYSDLFLQDFCDCALPIADSVPGPFDCELNGINVNRLDALCDARFCQNDNPRASCLCDNDYLFTQFPHPLNVQITSFCRVTIESHALGQWQNGVCACNYSPLGEVFSKLGCHLGTSSAAITTDSMAEFCATTTPCKDCLEAGSRFSWVSNDSNECDTCNEGDYGCVSLADGQSANNVCLETEGAKIGWEMIAGDDAETCIDNLGGIWGSDNQCYRSTGLEGETTCTLQACTEGFVNSANVPDVCDGVNCGDGSCYDGLCICPDNKMGADCTTDVVFLFLASQDPVDIDTTIDNIKYSVTLDDGISQSYRIASGGSAFVQASYTFNGRLCGFEEGKVTQKFLGGLTSASTSLVWLCFDTQEVRIDVKSTTATSDQVLAFSAEIEAGILAAAGDIETYQYTYAFENQQLVYYFRNDVGLSSAFADNLYSATSTQPNLAQFFVDDSETISFSLGNTASYVSNELTGILSGVTGIPEADIAMIASQEGNTVTLSVTFTGSESDINGLTSSVASGTFASALQAALTSSASYSASTLTMGSIRSVTVTFSGASVDGNVDTAQVLSATATTVPFDVSALDVTVASESSGNVVYTVVFAGDSAALTTATATLATPTFTSAFSSAMSSTAQGADASIQWGTVDDKSTEWTYSFDLLGVSQMNETELAIIMADSLTTDTTPISADMISFDTTSQGDTSYSIAVTFSGELYQISAIQLKMLNGWAVSFQSGLTASSIFNGATYAESGTTSSTSWSFELNDWDGSDADISAAVASALPVTESTITVQSSVSGSTTAVTVKFEDTTSNIVLVNLELSSGTFESTFEAQITAADSDAAVVYVNSDSLSFVYRITGISDSSSSTVESAFASWAGVDESSITVVVTPINNGFSYEFSVVGTAASLSSIEALLTSTDTGSFEAQLQSGGGDFASASVSLDEYDQYLPCVEFLFFFDGLCDDTARDLDVVYVIDSSSSFNTDEYTALKTFLVLTHRWLLPTGTRTAAMQFATITQIEWQLGTYDDLPGDMANYAAHISALQQIKGLTYTDNAVEKGMTLFDSESGADKLMIIVTDGVPTDNHSPCIDSDVDTKLRAASIEVIVFGIGPDFDEIASQNGVDCLATTPDHLIWASDAVNAQQGLNKLGAVTCPDGSPSGYDGIYFQQDNFLYNDHHVYKRGDDQYNMRFDGLEWFISDSSGTFISSQNGDLGIDRPVSGTAWTQYNNNNDVVSVFSDMAILGCTAGETDAPSLMPSVATSSAPTSTPFIKPTDNPTIVPPTKQPTDLTCDHLQIYRSGICPRNVDVIFLVDSSSSMQGTPFIELKDYLKFLMANVTEEYPQNSFRFSVSQFSGEDTAKVGFGLSDYTDLKDYETAVDALELLGGATYTKDAIEFVIDNVIPTSQNYDSETLFMLLTDGAPTFSEQVNGEGTGTDQRPCVDGVYDAGDLLIAENVLGIVLGVGDIAQDTSQVACVGYNDDVLFTSESYAEVGDALNTLFECKAPTLFDGRYSNTGVAASAGPWTIYENHLGYTLQANNNGNWAFANVNGDFMVSESLDAADQSFPKDAGAWRYVEAGGSLINDFVTYDPVRVVCADDSTPTKTPTFGPSTQPTRTPSGTPSIIPSNVPSITPSAAPTGLTRGPSTAPLIQPSLTPNQALVTDCATFSVFQGICDLPNGMDWVFLFDSADNVPQDVYDAFKQLSQDIVNDDRIIADPPPTTLGAIKYSGTFATDFANGDWDSKDEWIEYLRSLIRDTPAQDNRGDLSAAIDEAIYKLYAPVYSPDKDRAMVIFIRNTPTEFECEAFQRLSDRGIYTTMISIAPDFDLGTVCPATLGINYVNFPTPDAAIEADMFDYMCNEDMPFTGGYQRVSDELGDNGAYSYRSSTGVTLDHENEAWIFKSTDGENVFVSRGGETPYPPDKFCWDYVNDDVELHCMVRLVCSETQIPTQSPTRTPSRTPSYTPTTGPTTDTPSTSPSVDPTTKPSHSPSSSPESSDPTTSPSGSPSTTPTKTPTYAPTTDSPTRLPSVKPSGSPSTTPTTDTPSRTPSADPSITPSKAPTDDCVHFMVGIYNCAPTRYDGQNDGTLENPVVDTPYNGGYSRTERTENGMPVYSHSENWEAFYDGEVWVFRDPSGKMKPMAETDGTSFPYPENDQEYVVLDPFEIIPRVPICCVNTPIPTREPSNVPTTTPSDGPTGTPTISKPTSQPVPAPSQGPSRTPSSAPFGSPSVTPSRAPSNAPSVSGPSTSPSYDPSTNPSNLPTVVPTDNPSYGPSIQPSKNPTSDAPSREPSASPEYSVPTTTPSDNPTNSPSFSQPSKDPTVRPTVSPSDLPTIKPSRLPTTTPTFAPTDDCHHFFVGLCPCNNGTLIDLVIVMDGSNTVAQASGMFSGITQYLAEELEAILPEGARLGMVQYGTLPEVEFFPFDDLTREEQSQKIQDMTPVGGATWTRSALVSTLNTVWGSSLDKNRDQITMIITDGEPSSFQNPCSDATADYNGDIRANYDAQGIDIVPVAIDNENIQDERWFETLGCLSRDGRFNYRYFGPGSDYTTLMESVWETLDICEPQRTTDTPYNGGYSRIYEPTFIVDEIYDPIFNGKPVYRHSENYLALWQGETWMFYDPYKILGLMGEIEGGIQMYPESGKDWSMELEWDQSNYQRFDNLIICCESTATPTRTPSFQPTAMPSTDTPSRMPSDSPDTSEPTGSPTTDSPSKTPSRTPSGAPTTEDPTRVPSVKPTASPDISEPTTTPSKSPSSAPTTEQPTEIPTPTPSTDQPTLLPTTDSPTKNPSVQPTVSPSNYPTKAPTDDCEHLVVGIYYCETVTGSEILGDGITPHMESDFNGVYSRTDEIVNGKPTYRNGYNWEIYWDAEVWVMLKPDELFMYGEIVGGNQIYPESLKDWQYIDDGRVQTKEDLTICCSEYAAPSRTPSVSPSMAPTVSPSKAPTVVPTTNPSMRPSIQPTPEPSTSLPTRSPDTTSPTFSTPSTSPTTEVPTKSPTVRPSKNPVRSVPTTTPSQAPSMPPSSEEPTLSPQTKSPSVSPSTAPTMAPTDDCVHFLVGEGCPCTNHDIVDYVILVDGSDSISEDAFNAAKESIAEFVRDSKFPTQGKLAVVEFGSGQTTVAASQPGDDTSTTAQDISDMEQSGGNTFTETAMEYVYQEFFGDEYPEENRQGFVVIVQSGLPAVGQDISRSMTKYDDIDVNVKFVGIDSPFSAIDEFSVAEPNDYTKQFYYNEFYTSEQEESISTAIWRNLEPNCAYGEYDTPFNGYYSRTDDTREGRPVYRDQRNDYIVEFDSEVWTFHDETGAQDPMAENQIGVQMYPETLRNWTWASPPDFPGYDLVVICCVDFAAPTKTPTVPPTDMPSKGPSTSRPTDFPTTEEPTDMPTRNPTSDSPSQNPTSDSPSQNPTSDSPSQNPTTDTPTRSPSSAPTSDQPTRTPSRNPSSSMPSTKPTCSPTRNPTTDTPTKNPVTSEPTKSPESSDPTVSPSFAPSEVPTSSIPTKNPVSSEPTISPESSDPTVSPSTAPTSAPVTSRPSRAPNTRPPTSSIPTNVPTTDSPTNLPSRSPTTETPTTTPSSSPSNVPSVEPTKFPTLSPTDDCAHFVLTPCELQNVEEVDVLFIIDTSTSISDDDYSDLMFTLGQAVGQYFPDNDVAQLGLLQFASRPAERIPISTRDSNSDWAETIKYMDRDKGATWTKTAFQHGLDMWEAADTFEGRTRMTVLITDGVPSFGQSPCNLIQEYADNNIDIAVMGFGDASASEDLLKDEFTCFSDLGYPTFAYPTFDSSVEAIQTIFGVINFCDLETTVFTPYGTSVSFSRDPSAVYNERPIYVASEGWTFRWMGDGDADPEGYWNLYDPAEVYGYMNSTSFSSQSFPITGMEWVYDNYTRNSWTSETRRGDDSLSLYDPVTIVCQDTATPTKTPSEFPSTTPTVPPTEAPTRFPTTDTPSTSPTFFPTNSPITTDPTMNPSESPSTSPTSDSPSRTPSNSPTVDPTKNPSQHPTNESPSTFPSTYPSKNPTTEEPTCRPTVESPSVSPSVDPTGTPSGSPTVDSPSRTPSTEPTGTPSGTPTISQPSGQPTVMPTMAPSRSPTECAIAVTACEEECHEKLTALNETCTGRLSCDECYKEDVESMAATVADLTASVEEYQTCMSSADQIQAVQDVSDLLTEVSDMLKSDNVEAWRKALELAGPALDCSHIPVEWCSFQRTSNNEICTNQNGACLPL